MKKNSRDKNIKNKLLRILFHILLVVVAIPILLTIVFQIPAVQTTVARYVTSAISKDIDQTIDISAIKISLFSGVTINDLEILDHHDNVLISINQLSAAPVLSKLSFTNLHFINIKVDEATFNMGSYKGESSDNLSQLINNFSSESNDSKGEFKMFSKSIVLMNSKFNLFNQNRDYSPGENMMDYANMLFDSINISIHNFRLINDSLHFKILNLSTKEISGLDIKDLSADFTISSSCLEANQAIINVNESELDVDFRMKYNNYKSLSYFIDSVDMYGNIRPSKINIADIGHFSDILFQMPNEIGVTGEMHGKVSNLSTKDVRIKYGKNTRISGDISFKGLPDFFSSLIIAENIIISTNTGDIKSFDLPILEKPIDLTNVVKEDKQISLMGNYNGYYEDFKSNIELSSYYGSINSDINFNTVDGLINFNAKLTSDSLNIGKLLDMNDILGKTSFNIQASGSGYSLEQMKYQLNCNLTKLDLFGYEYSRIGIKGLYFSDSINADLRIGDKNLMMEALVKADIDGEPAFKVNANIVRANMDKLKLISGYQFAFSSEVDIDIKGTDLSTLNTDISLMNSMLFFDDNQYQIDSINISKHTNTEMFTSAKISSDILDMNAEGYYDIETVTNSFYNLVDNYYNIIKVKDKTEKNTNKNIKLNLTINDPRIFTEQFLMGVNIATNTSLNSDFDFTNHKIDLNLNSDQLNINTVRADTANFNITTIGDSLIGEFSIVNFILKDSSANDSLVLGIDNFNVSSKIYQDSIIYGINWNNRNQSQANSGILEGYFSKVEDSTKLSIYKADVFINDVRWSIDSNNLVTIFNDRVLFHDFNINAGPSKFSLLGIVPRSENDSLIAKFYDWDLSTFNIVTEPYNLRLYGQVNGELKLGMVRDNPTLSSNININKLGINDETLGDAEIINTWNNSSNTVFINTNIVREGDVGKGNIFSANGSYQPFKKKDNLKIDISFNRFKLHTIEPFLSDFINDLEGSSSGDLKLRGSVKEPILTGNAKLDRAGLRVVYLNTKYSFTNSLEFVKNGIEFDKLVIYDTLGNKAQINGSLKHEFFSDPNFDISIATNGLLFFNTSENMNDLYYGSAICSGKIDIKGSPSDIDLKIHVDTKKNTSVVLPLDYSVEISDKDYIIFTKKDVDSISDAESVVILNKNKGDKLKYNINVGLNVTPVAQVGINLPDDMGKITARGSSNLAIDVNSNGKFSLVGDYIVQDGLFQFRIGNLVSKRFELVQGGRISWSGNPYSANVNIRGLYKVKTSLASLGIQMDTTASYKNKVTVECYVVLTDELLNPNIKFEIAIPDLDPDYQRAVFSELDTTNTAMMNQQMISLLVLGTFSFNNASSVSLQSSYYNVIANQLSSMLSQISKNVDIGLNYKPGDNVSQEEFELALSTQLFDDRLTIDGNFGMTYDRSEQSASNIVGDVDVGYKLTPDGQWILKVFNHSNVNSWYNYSGYDQTSPYTQGVGIAFIKDFNNIRELFESKKKKEKQPNNDTNKESTKPDEPTN